ncbi:flagellar assembly protein FliW [Porcipelethomonas sp.]|uniref:flagellar assembly protein FliW n=1 Tax=Porcipelethomonas sp. TaxID=2981675 RepID=UPI003EF3EF03
MKVLTRDFGEVEVNNEDIIKFESKIFGFDEYSDFIILYDDDFNGEYAWLQSVEEPGLCFIIANSALIPDYKPVFETEAEKVLGKGQFEYWLMMVVSENIQDSTVNLKSPIIINLCNNKAMQLILEDEYPVKYYLFKSGKEKK